VARSGQASKRRLAPISACFAQRSIAPPGAAAVTDAQGDLIAANGTYTEWFGAVAPSAQEGEAAELLRSAAAAGFRDGRAMLDGVRLGGLQLKVEIVRAGLGHDHLLWRFDRADDGDLGREARRLVTGEAGQRLGEAGLMIALADRDGNLVAGNRAFAVRCSGKPDAVLSAHLCST
jgi:two-component system cell cycle sensor histidine kinase/response regulator CckA